MKNHSYFFHLLTILRENRRVFSFLGMTWQMMRYKIFFPIYFSLVPWGFAQDVVIPVSISQQICHSWLKKQPDLKKGGQGSSEESESIVVPADFSDPSLISKSMTVPLKFNAKDLFSIPSQEKEENFKETTQSLELIKNLHHKLIATLHGIEDGQKIIDNNLMELSLKIKDAHEEERVKELLHANIKAFESAVNHMRVQPEIITEASDLLAEVFSILEQHFHAYEADPGVIEKNKLLRQESITIIAEILRDLKLSLNSLAKAKSSFEELRQKFFLNPGAFLDAFDTLLKSLNTINMQLNQVRDLFEENGLLENPDDGILLQKNLLKRLADQFEELSDDNHGYLDQVASLELEVIDGKLYFNDQPIVNEKEVIIREVCRKLMQ